VLVGKKKKERQEEKGSRDGAKNNKKCNPGKKNPQGLLEKGTW